MKSDNVRVGMQQAPHRSLFNALGMTKEEMERPLVGIVCSYNEIVPGHMNLDKIAQAVKMGVAMAGGTPVMFPAIAVCDGIAMGHIGMKYSLVTRDLIADSTEAMAIAHQFDALVMIPNCDKNVPGLLMAAARVNVPTVFVSGGPMLAGHVKGNKTSLSSMFEAVGSYAAGTMTEEDVYEYECKTCPTCGSCSGMYTANSMNCLTEALGMGLPGNGTILQYIQRDLSLQSMQEWQLWICTERASSLETSSQRSQSSTLLQLIWHLDVQPTLCSTFQPSHMRSVSTLISHLQMRSAQRHLTCVTLLLQATHTWRISMRPVVCMRLSSSLQMQDSSTRTA